MNNNPHHFPAKSVGRLALCEVPVISPQTKVKAAIELLKKPNCFQSINYFYVTSAKNKLLGVFSIKELLKADNNLAVSEIMKRELIIVHAHTLQERAAFLAVKNSLKAIPIVDPQGKFLGIITSDEISRILNKEHLEDLLYSAGISPFQEDPHSLSVLTHFKSRFPWLVLGLSGGILAAVIIEIFSNALAELFLLAAFIPAVVYIGDAVGTQSQTIFIRSLALNPKLKLATYFLKEALASLLIGICLSFLVGFFSLLIWHEPILSLILALSFIVTICLASLVAVLFPLLLRFIGCDPAVASGPLASVVRDLLSISFYLLISQLVLKIF